MILEVVVESISEAKLAAQYGAGRVELCTALDLGGLTPAPGLLFQCVRETGIEVHAMIRVRQGGFVYTDEEVAVMRRDVQCAAELGAKGVVFGLLTDNGSIDLANTRLLTEYAKSLDLEVTFHRAIDFCSDWRAGLKALTVLGADRVLTSGQGTNAGEGKAVLAEMLREFGSKIQIMAGGGVTPEIADELASLDLAALHINIRMLRQPVPGAQGSQMGNEYDADIQKLESIARRLGLAMAGC
jgi:copper homeostasis protein